jgi:cysteine desulfurase/selenocysteine lyase
MSINSDNPSVDIDVNLIRRDFPVLQTMVHNKSLVYLDNGATTQKPRIVIDKLNELYETKNSSIHRGVHFLSEQMTGEYEYAREVVRKFINARDTSEIIFTSGATGSINTLAFSFGEKYIKEGDEFQRWNTIPILFPGKCCAAAKKRN